MRSLKFLVGQMCVISLLFSIHVRGQQLAPLPLEVALGAHSFGQYSPVTISNDGKRAAYVVADNHRATSFVPGKVLQTGILGPPISGDICLTDLTSDNTQCLTGGKGNNWDPSWSPDGHHLAFLSDRDDSGQAKVWVWEAASNQLRKISDASVRADGIRWMPDSSRLSVTVLPADVTPSGYARRVPGGESISPDINHSAPPAVLVYRSETTATVDRKDTGAAQLNLDVYRRDLAIIEIGSGRMRRVSGGQRVANFAPSPNGAYLAFTSPTQFEDPATQQILFDLLIVDLKTGKKQTTAANVPLDYDGSSFDWSPDGSRLGFQTSGPQGKEACYVVEVNSPGSPRKVTEPLQQSPFKAAAPLWDRTGRHIYFVNGGALWLADVEKGRASELSTIAGHKIVQVVAGPDNTLWSPEESESSIVLTRADGTNQSGFYSIDLENGQYSKLLEEGQCYTCVIQEQWVSVAPRVQKLVYFAGDAQHDVNLWVTDPGFRHPRPLTHLNPQFGKYQMGASQLIEWRSLDGELLEGALLLPAGYVPGMRYPLIVNVYGGTRHSDRLNHFGFGYAGIDNMQLFATRGYAVLLPDAPQNVGTPMLDLVKTVLPGVNRVIEMGIADPDRLGVMGHSYGGYCALSLLAQTTRFKAAVMSAGNGDLVAEYGEMDRDGSTYAISILETGQGLMGGGPWQYRERYIDNSPIYYLDRIKTPLLIVHGTEDQAVAPFLADEIFVGLRRLGKETEYAKYQGESHSPFYWSYANQLDYCRRIMGWFDKYLKGSTS